MGAQIKIDARTAIIDGGHPLSGARVKATDLRSGPPSSWLGWPPRVTEVTELHHIDRGYVSWWKN